MEGERETDRVWGRRERRERCSYNVLVSISSYDMLVIIT